MALIYVLHTFLYTLLSSTSLYTLPSSTSLSINMPKVLTLKKQLKEVSQKRKSLTVVQKKEVCQKKLSTSSIKQKELAIEYDVSKGMISDILKEKDRWLAIDIDSYQAGLKRKKKLHFP